MNFLSLTQLFVYCDMTQPSVQGIISYSRERLEALNNKVAHLRQRLCNYAEDYYEKFKKSELYKKYCCGHKKAIEIKEDTQKSITDLKEQAQGIVEEKVEMMKEMVTEESSEKNL